MIETTTIQERYAQAIQSSNLRCDTTVHARSSADLLIAASWCKSKFGASLMRLQAEWDGAERWGIKVPVKPTKRAIQAEAQVTMKEGVRKVTAASMEAARKQLEDYYEAEMRKLAGALKSLPEVITQLEIKLILDGYTVLLATPLLLHWLDPVCKVCQGTGWQEKRPASICGKCQAHPGFAPVPGGEVGRSLLVLLDNCCTRAQNEIRRLSKY